MMMMMMMMMMMTTSDSFCRRSRDVPNLARRSGNSQIAIAFFDSDHKWEFTSITAVHLHPIASESRWRSPLPSVLLHSGPWQISPPFGSGELAIYFNRWFLSNTSWCPNNPCNAGWRSTWKGCWLLLGYLYSWILSCFVFLRRNNKKYQKIYWYTIYIYIY